MTDRQSRIIDFRAGIEWRGQKFGEVFVGDDRQSRGLANPPEVFGGIPGTWNPEDMLVGSLALCQLLTYLHFVEANGIELISYKNDVVGTLTKGKDGFEFTHFKIVVDTVVASGDKEKCEKALELSKRFCLVSNSLSADEEYSFNISEIE